MKNLISALLLAISAINAAPVNLPPQSKSGDIIPDQYIVVFKDSVTADDVVKHWDWLHQKITPTLHVQNSNSWLENFDILFTYEVGEFKAYAAKLPKFLYVFIFNL
jgi:hypothetical protein